MSGRKARALEATGEKLSGKPPSFSSQVPSLCGIFVIEGFCLGAAAGAPFMSSEAGRSPAGRSSTSRSARERVGGFCGCMILWRTGTTESQVSVGGGAHGGVRAVTADEIAPLVELHRRLFNLWRLARAATMSDTDALVPQMDACVVESVAALSTDLDTLKLFVEYLPLQRYVCPSPGFNLTKYSFFCVRLFFDALDDLLTTLKVYRKDRLFFTVCYECKALSEKGTL